METMETLPPPIKLEPLKRKSKPQSKAARKPWWRRSEGPRALRDVRERKGISLETIAERTRIPLHHLEEIERGDVSNLPPGIYAKSWAREYAQEIGVPPETVLAAVAPVAAVEPTIDEIREVREARERRVEETAAALEPGFSLSGLFSSDFMRSDLMKKIATVAIVLTLLVVAGVYLWKATAPEQVQTIPVTAPAPTGTSGVAPAQPAQPPQ